MSAILKSKRVITVSGGEKLTDELFAELSVTQQLLAKIGEAVEVDIQIATFKDNGNKYVSRDSIMAIHDALFS